MASISKIPGPVSGTKMRAAIRVKYIYRPRTYSLIVSRGGFQSCGHFFFFEVKIILLGLSDCLFPFRLLFGAVQFDKTHAFADASHDATRLRAEYIKCLLRDASAACRRNHFTRFHIRRAANHGGAARGRCSGDDLQTRFCDNSAPDYIFYAENNGILPAADDRYKKQIGMDSIIASINAARAAKKAVLISLHDLGISRKALRRLASRQRRI